LALDKLAKLWYNIGTTKGTGNPLNRERKTHMFITIKDTTIRISTITAVRKGRFSGIHCLFVRADGVEYRFDYKSYTENEEEYNRILSALPKR
jgi:hypothetical protein